MRVLIATGIVAAAVLSRCGAATSDKTNTTTAVATIEAAATATKVQSSNQAFGGPAAAPCKFEMGSGKEGTCNGLSASCCSAVQGARARLVRHASPYVIGKCGRADQVAGYKCALGYMPPAVKKKPNQICAAEPSAKTGTDGSGECSMENMQQQPAEIDGVSKGCCDAVRFAEATSKATRGPQCYNGRCGAAKLAAMCGLVGACGKKDQQSVAKGYGIVAKDGGPHPGELELLETFNMTLSGAQQMMATFMTSEAEDDVTKDDDTKDGATENGSQIVTGLLGFVAGAAVAGLGVVVLRRRTPSSQDEYNEIVA